MNRDTRWLRPLLVLVAAGLLLAILPRMAGSYALVWVSLLCVYLTLAASYDIVGGYMGYMNLGHSTFFGLGAYGTAILLNLGLGLPLALAGGVAIAACFAALVGYPLFRLRGAYFALGTFGMISLMAVLANNLRDLTGGSGGISTPSGDHTVGAYYLSVLIVAVTLTSSYLISRSRFGLALFSIREDEEVARALGTPTSFYKVLALVISSVPASLIGGVYVWSVTYISPPAVFGLEIALSPIVMAMLGGTGTLVGPLLGAVFLTSLQELLWTEIPYLHLTIYGGMMVVIGLFMPGGIVRTRWFRPVLEVLGLGEKVSYLDRS